MKTIKPGKYPDIKVIVRIILTIIIVGLNIWIWTDDMRISAKFLATVASLYVLNQLYSK